MIHVPPDTRPVLLGMDNPLSQRSEHVLYPYPVGCTGHRLWQMLESRVPGVSRAQYLSAFDRRNLCLGSWSKQAAYDRAKWLKMELRGREVVVLGVKVREAIGLPDKLIEPIVRDEITWRQIPHPSGRNPWYSEPTHRVLVAVLLEQLYRSVHLVETN